MSHLRQWLLPALLVLFSLISVITLNSVAQPFASQQLIFFVISLVLFGLVSRVSFSLLSQYRWLAYAALVALLILTLIIGTLTNGTRRWISVGGFFSVQASQLAVPIVGLVVAKKIKSTKDISFKNLTQILLLLFIPGLLISIAPDLGTTIVYLASIGIFMWLGPVPIKWLGTIAGLGIITIIIGWFFLIKDYQKQRITCFIERDNNPTCSEYNARQSLIAVGSGELFGKGLGQGIQSHLKFLPERQTDFIFASFAEEWGFFGSILLLSLFVIMISHIISIGRLMPSYEDQIFCMMIATYFAVQVIVHIGMNMYLFPITGITLPFISYGGSSLIGMTLSIALIQSAAKSIPTREHHHFA
jgi:rod shape determining protein RodA